MSGQLWREARDGELPAADLWPRRGVQRGMSMVLLPEGTLVIEDGIEAARLRGAKALAAKARPGFDWSKWTEQERAGWLDDAGLMFAAAVGKGER